MDYSKYENPIEYPKKPYRPVCPKSEATAQEHRVYADRLEQYDNEMVKYRADKEEYNKYAAWKDQEFQIDALEDVGLTGHPLAERAFGYAWDEGHYAGKPEVYSKLTRIAQVILGDSNYTPAKPSNPMRERVLARIDQIRKDQNGFSDKTMRWKNIFYAQIHISRVDFTGLTDYELLDILETIIRRLYVQM